MEGFSEPWRLMIRTYGPVRLAGCVRGVLKGVLPYCAAAWQQGGGVKDRNVVVGASTDKVVVVVLSVSASCL